MVDGTQADPEQLVDERGMRQSTDADALGRVVDEVLERCESQVQQYHDGNRKVVGFLVGQCMKASKGSGNPKMFNQLLVRRLAREGVGGQAAQPSGWRDIRLQRGRIEWEGR